MSEIKWITPKGQIASIAEEEYFEFQLDAYDTEGLPLTYTVIAGNLTDGLGLTKTGMIQGVASVEEASVAQQEYSQTFTVRVTNGRGQINDRTFSIVTNSISIPQIIPKNISLGTWYDGYFIDLQLEATDQNSIAGLEWKLIDGELPPGLELTEEGRIFGYLEPVYLDEEVAILHWDNGLWDGVLWDQPTARPQTRTYRFEIQVFDGARFDLSRYTLTVQAKGTLSVDNTELTVDNTTITVDTDDQHAPYIITQPQELPEQRQLSNFAFKVAGRDLDGDTLHWGILTENAAWFDQEPTLEHPGIPTSAFDQDAFDQIDFTLPPGVTIDEATGWITGSLGVQTEEVKTYKFQVYCWTEVDNVETARSQLVTFTLTVLGDRNNTIDWVTPEDLGLITNGDISEISIVAVSRKGKTLNYRIAEGTPNPIGIEADQTVIEYTPVVKSKLPQGLTLLPNGLLVGRVSFDHFSMDSRTTTFDKNTLFFDNVYTFTVTASDDTDPTVVSNETVSDDKTFTVKVKNYNIHPYENIYLKALPSRDQRETFLTTIADTDIFPDPLIYRAGDPWFGKANSIKFLFAAGLEPNLAASYLAEMENTHYNKQVNLGNIKTAIATDANFNVKYEIVYVEVLDELTENGKSIASSIDRTAEVRTPYNVPPFTVVYPNSLDNMKAEVGAVGYNNKGALPQWMINPQEDGRVLGFTRGVILAYTVPGASKLIAYRLKQNNISFNNVDFVADRYQLDHTLSKFYDTDEKKFIDSAETTFDRLPPNTEQNPYAGTVDYAVTIPFDEVNGRTIHYITIAGGLDGSVNIKDGQYVVFAKQEKYSDGFMGYTKDAYDANNFDALGFNLSVSPREYNSPNDGWNQESVPYGSDPWGSEPYAPSTVIPGFLDKLLNNEVNQRAGIWQIVLGDAANYEDKLVTLVFVKEVEINQHVLVGTGGRNYGNSKIYYNPITQPGNTVPTYTILTTENKVAGDTTRFDGGGTRFYNNRDMYLPPESLDVYLKFPKTNIYN